MSPTPCRECGATNCEEAFHRCLAADYTDAAYGAVHHLVVPTYGLQHGWYTDEAAVVAFVQKHLDRPPTDHDRRSIRRAASAAERVRAREQQAPGVTWDVTVVDVDSSSAAAYAATIRGWAASVASRLGGRRLRIRP